MSEIGSTSSLSQSILKGGIHLLPGAAFIFLAPSTTQRWNIPFFKTYAARFFLDQAVAMQNRSNDAPL
ncbi:MAG: hypothetical protein ACI8R4_000714 [Paracoccaceae bacterium]|jgi:hypothetical protein